MDSRQATFASCGWFLRNALKLVCRPHVSSFTHGSNSSFGTSLFLQPLHTHCRARRF